MYLIQWSCSNACCPSHTQGVICFSNYKLCIGPYRAILQDIQLRTTWRRRWGRGILKNDSSVGVTTVTGAYKSWDGKLSAHTSRLGLYGSPTAATGWEQPEQLTAPNRSWTLPRWVWIKIHIPYTKSNMSIFCVSASASSYLWGSDLLSTFILEGFRPHGIQFTSFLFV